MLTDKVRRQVGCLAFLVFLGCEKSPERPTPPGKASPSASESQAPTEPKRRSDRMATKAPAGAVADRGIFSDLDEKVTVSCPSWLSAGPHLTLASSQTKQTWLSVEGIVVCEAPEHAFDGKATLVLERAPQDHDDDGIPDAVDILRGAKKAAENGAKYQNNYRKLTFPRGDVPREEGVCTDVIIRALRNAGFDLQELLSRDIKSRPGAYPMVKKPDTNIDHRRVRTILPYFEHAYTKLPTDPRDSAFPYFPGDIVFMNTIGDSEPEHVGVVSDVLGGSGLPLIINNWTEGTVTRSMDLLRSVPVTHRFRTTSPLRLEGEHEGLGGLLKRHEISLPPDVHQVVLVTTPLWTSSGGTLRGYVRTEDGFDSALEPILVRIGSRGLGRGRGLVSAASSAPTVKKEGDKKAPAGVFRFGTAFGTQPTAPYRGKGWPYRPTTPDDYWVDDPKSPDYNRWVTPAAGQQMKWSAERLSRYSLGLVVEHNTTDTEPGAGSAIFIHPWRTPETSTVGCTALAANQLEMLLGWLDPKAHPVLIQIAGHVVEGSDQSAGPRLITQ